MGILSKIFGKKNNEEEPEVYEYTDENGNIVITYEGDEDPYIIKDVTEEDMKELERLEKLKNSK